MQWLYCSYGSCNAFSLSPLNFQHRSTSMVLLLNFDRTKANFKNKYRFTHLLCDYCTESDDTQQHILQCKVLKSHLQSKEAVNENVEYNDLFKNVHKQKVIVTMFTKLLDIRNVLKNQEKSTNPSILDRMLERSYNLQPSNVNFSSGT